MIRIPSRFYGNLVIIMFAIGCFAGLFKLFFTRYFLLTADLLMILLVFFVSPVFPYDHQDRIKSYFLDVLVIGLIILGFVQAFNTCLPSIKYGLFYYRVSTYSFFAYFVGRKLLFYPRELRRIVNALIFVFVPINCLYAIKQYFFTSAFDLRLAKLFEWSTLEQYGSFRVNGFFQGPVQLGLFSAVCFVVCFYILVFSRWRTGKIYSVVILFISFCSLMISGSRSCMVGAIICILWFLISRFNLFKVVRVVILVMAVAFCLMYFYRKVGPEGFDWPTKRVYSFFHLSEDRSFFEGRILRWEKNTIPMILNKPWGRGCGSASVGREGLAMKDGLNVETESIYFTTALDLGWIGLLIFVVYCTVVVYAALKLLKTQPTIVSCFLSTAVITFAIAGLASPIMSAFPSNWLFCFCGPLVIGFVTKKI